MPKNKRVPFWLCLIAFSLFLFNYSTPTLEIQKYVQIEDYSQTLLEKLLENDEYLEGLYYENRILEFYDGSIEIISNPLKPIKMPIKKKDFLTWTEQDKLYLNVRHYPWPEDEVCKKFSIRFPQPGSLPMMGLASFPNSGNTWLRYLIEGLTGYYTGSVYNDNLMRSKGYYGEGVPADAGLVLTVKTHGLSVGAGSISKQHKSHEMMNHTAILLIRDPFKAIIGFRHRAGGGSLRLANKKIFNGSGWNSFVNYEHQTWYRFYSEWLTDNPPDQVLVVHYADLLYNLKTTLRTIGTFLKVPIDETRLDCVSSYSDGLFRRNHSGEEIGDPFSEDQKRKINATIDKLNILLEKYDKGPVQLEM